MKANQKLNMVTTVNKFIKENVNKNKNKQIIEMIEKDIFATDVYTLGYQLESKANLDYTQNMIIIK